MATRRFFKNLTILLLPFAIIVAFVNYFIDPAKVFSGDHYIKEITLVVLKGHNVENISNYDQRLGRKYFIEAQPSSPDVIVLGSSRLMELGMDFYADSNLKAINCCVSHASIMDIAALVGISDSAKKLPKKFVINVDPDLINGTTDEWQSIEPYYKYITQKFGKKRTYLQYHKEYFKKLLTLFSPSYFRAALGNIRSSGTYRDVGTRRPEFGEYADGTVCYPLSYMHPTDTEKIFLDGEKEGKQKPLNSPQPGLVNLFNDLLTFLQSKGVHVELIMIPYSPGYYLGHSNEKYNIQFYENLLKKIAVKHNVEIRGSLNPHTYNFSMANFYDMYHCNRISVQKVASTRP